MYVTSQQCVKNGIKLTSTILILKDTDNIPGLATKNNLENW